MAAMTHDPDLLLPADSLPLLVIKDILSSPASAADAGSEGGRPIAQLALDALARHGVVLGDDGGDGDGAWHRQTISVQPASSSVDGYWGVCTAQRSGLHGCCTNGAGSAVARFTISGFEQDDSLNGCYEFRLGSLENYGSASSWAMSIFSPTSQLADPAAVTTIVAQFQGTTGQSAFYFSNIPRIDGGPEPGRGDAQNITALAQKAVVNTSDVRVRCGCDGLEAKAYDFVDADGDGTTVSSSTTTTAGSGGGGGGGGTNLPPNTNSTHCSTAASWAGACCTDGAGGYGSTFAMHGFDSGKHVNDCYSYAGQLTVEDVPVKLDGFYGNAMNAAFFVPYSADVPLWLIAENTASGEGGLVYLCEAESRSLSVPPAGAGACYVGTASSSMYTSYKSWDKNSGTVSSACGCGSSEATELSMTGAAAPVMQHSSLVAAAVAIIAAGVHLLVA
ncbi:hypothetical protein JKP88DRAFT_249674 [Tribonema minus]|uniref:Uncharacterized protein n=1 Tax=Tribonema minus TaxID=303371 RepID=A0A835YIS7_9STRA|nr:hypothetical protein JKP88DRAFT_249674 [Tribonema minus]